MRTNQTPPSHRLIGKFQCQVNCQTTFLSDIKRVWYCSPTRIPNRDKKTESPYLVHPSLSEILPGNLTLSGAYWFKTDSGPLTFLHCTLVTGIKCSKLLYFVEKSAGQSPF